jgi:hypothetical protein
VVRIRSGDHDYLASPTDFSSPAELSCITPSWTNKAARCPAGADVQGSVLDLYYTQHELTANQVSGTHPDPSLHQGQVLANVQDVYASQGSRRFVRGILRDDVHCLYLAIQKARRVVTKHLFDIVRWDPSSNKIWIYPRRPSAGNGLWIWPRSDDSTM